MFDGDAQQVVLCIKKKGFVVGRSIVTQVRRPKRKVGGHRGTQGGPRGS